MLYAPRPIYECIFEANFYFRNGGIAMKKRLMAVLCALLALLLSLPAFAASYSDTSYPLYRVWTVVADNQLYMYPVAGSSGEPLCAYKKGTLLRVTEWYVYGSNNYCYAVGPDGREGYVWKPCLLKHYDYNDASLPVYTVNSTHYESGAYRLYMYPSPSSSGDPVGVGGYVNGTKLKVIDWQVDSTYCYAVGPDEHCGFVRKSWLNHTSGTEPTETKPATEYYWPGMVKNQGTASSGSKSSGNSGSSSSSANSGNSNYNNGSANNGGSTLTPPSGYGKNSFNGYNSFTDNSGSPAFNGTAMNGQFTARASSYAGSGSDQGDPGKAIDGNAYTSWDADGEYEGAWIELNSTSGPKTINGLRIQNGNRRRTYASSTYYYRYSRVKSFSLYVDGIYVMSGKLDDTSDWQNVAFGYSITGTSFRIYIDGVYQGTGSPYNSYGVSIADILLV